VRSIGLCLVVLVTACAWHAHVAAPVVDPSSVAAGCGDAPRAPHEHFRHVGSRLASMLGSSRHRGIDLIAADTDPTQTLGGKLAYGAFDQDAEDEDVALFACVEHGWRSLGTARTDEHGRFALTLAGDRRLPIGMHDLYATALGDGTGVRFLAYVAPAGTRVVVSDVDGTLTRSERAMLATVVFGRDLATQPDAPAALRGLVASGHPIVYVTGRGDQYTEVTRDWLRRHGFPRGPLRLAPATTMPSGARTIDYKAGALRGLHLPVAAAIGNRASDITAYGRAGVAPDRIFVHLPEFSHELAAPLAAHRATGFTDYAALDELLR
jgi:phosphatidate phosphatase PAH1